MALNIKVRNNTVLADEVRQYLEKRFAKIEKLLPENAFIEVEFIDQFGERGGVDKMVQVDISVPGGRDPIHLENAAADWQTSIDVLKDRLETDLIRDKEKLIDGRRTPRPDKS